MRGSVRAEQDLEELPGKSLAQLADRVDRVRHAASLDFEPGRHQAGQAIGTQLDHAHAVLGARVRLLTMRRTGVGHQPHLFEIGDVEQLPSGLEMAIVYWIERPAHDADAGPFSDPDRK